MQYKKTTNRSSNGLSIDGVKRPPLQYRFITAGDPKRLKEERRPTALSSLGKIGGVTLLSLILLAGLTSVGSTVSYFNNTERSVGNIFKVAIADLRLSAANDEEGTLRGASLSLPDGVISEDAPANEEESEEYGIGSKYFEVSVGEGENSLPLVYSLSGELDKDNPAGCENLSIVADIEDTHFASLFTEFNVPNTSAMGTWDFEILLPEDNPTLPPLALCKGNIVFKAELAGITQSLSQIFTDEEKYSFELQNWDKKAEIAPASFASESLVVEENASSTPELPPQGEVLGDTATGTPDVIEGTTTPETPPASEGDGSSGNTESESITPEEPATEEASSTPEGTTETPDVPDDTASSTPEAIVEPPLETVTEAALEENAPEEAPPTDTTSEESSETPPETPVEETPPETPAEI